MSSLRKYSETFEDYEIHYSELSVHFLRSPEWNTDRRPAEWFTWCYGVTLAGERINGGLALDEIDARFRARSAARKHQYLLWKDLWEWDTANHVWVFKGKVEK